MRCVQGGIIERLSGHDYEVYIDENILKPLQMYQSYFDRSPYRLLKYRSASYSLSDGSFKEARFNFGDNRFQRRIEYAAD
jgi:CubicO group peptidase (beta-lactamase class C family)